MPEHIRDMQAAAELGIYEGQQAFLEHPITQATVGVLTCFITPEIWAARTFASSAAVTSKAAKASMQGFKSFSSFKRVMGPAGKGQAWHHIVEQTPGNLAKFGNQTIHNTNNLVKLPHGAGSIHTRISGYYSSIQPFTGGLTVRQWLSTQSYQSQYNFGIQILKNFGWAP